MVESRGNHFSLFLDMFCFPPLGSSACTFILSNIYTPAVIAPNIATTVLRITSK